jgi:hypothetical protein
MLKSVKLSDFLDVFLRKKLKNTKFLEFGPLKVLGKIGLKSASDLICPASRLHHY